MEKKTLILDQNKIALKLQRMAFQIWENNSLEKEVILIGVESSGKIIAHLLAKKLRKISSLKIEEMSITVNKKNPLQSPSSFTGKLDNKSVVLVDDVTNSGRTLLYAMRPLLDFNLKKIMIAVLVDRKHKSFPVSPDIVGHSIATTLQEHIEVECKGEEIMAAYLV